ncbi:hypothetical protein HMF8227_02681 [Saliniradius amylolyticus]|uniref:Response regulatory domain-containing protein n=1 Tax=Saliniradius amylolyticus TaxID=2183582 RepID=A0A2S2E672_9ALTE|nr:response regulator [Saliniradius amylolyticus]AWL13133.1 hypothetical protein HMF8227_02681 [Saliniradius amylolyticus]
MFEIPKPKSVDQLSAIIIDQQALVRDSLKNTLYRIGVPYIRGADRAHQAISEFRQRDFELVLISFDLNADKDGFHLLEELKFKGFVKKSTCVIFLSADTDNTLVHSVVEMQPDDFWSKPLDLRKIEKRLGRILNTRRKLFNPFYCSDKGEYSRAIYYAERYLKDEQFKAYQAKLNRLIGDCLCQLGEYKDAEAYYRTLLKSVNFGWVHIGLTHCLLKQGKIEEAEANVAALKKRKDTCCSVHDLLANYYVDEGDYPRAYEEIQAAVKLSPRNIERNRRAWDLARLNHDREGQYVATTHMARFAKNSIHDSPQLTLNMLRSGIDLSGASDEEQSHQLNRTAERHLYQLQKSYPGEEFINQLLVLEARLMVSRGDKKGAEKKLEQIHRPESNTAFEENLDLAKLWHETGHREKAVALLREMQKHVTDDTFSGHIIQRYLEQELDERQAIHFSPKELSDMASTYYKQDRLEQALSSLQKALTLSPSSTQIALSTLKVLAKMAERGDDLSEQLELMQSCDKLLADAKLSSTQAQELAEYRQQLNQQNMEPVESD